MPAAADHPIGVAGVGVVGTALGRHLLHAGFPVHCYDVHPAASERLASSGAHVAANARELGERCAVVLVAVGFAEEVRALTEGDRGLLAHMRPGSVLVVVSTVEPALMVELGAAAAAGVEVVDAPVVGGAAAAERGELLVLAGGSEGALRSVQDVLDCFARRVCRLGPLGAGQIGKALNNLLLWSATCANAHAERLAIANGLDWPQVREALLDGSGANRALANWAVPRQMPWAEKDLQIIARLSTQAGAPSPLLPALDRAVRELKAERGLPVPRPTGTERS